MSAVATRAQIAALPKAHLHLHLEGSARPATIRELAERAGTRPPQLACDSFAAFDRLYMAMLDVIRAPEDLARICRELVEDEAAVGVRYVEPSINPHYWGERFGRSTAEAYAVMRDAFDEAGVRHGVEVGLMVGVPRVVGSEAAEAMATFAAAHAGAGVVSLGICGDEPADAHRPFRRACEIAREAGLLIVPHAGEQQGPASLAEALEVLAPDRVAHGIRAVEDAALLGELAAREIVCDVCPSSNVGIGVVASLDVHPLPRMRAAGVPVTLGTDDALFFDVDLVDEYATAQRLCGVGAVELAQIARDGARASGASERTKAAMLKGIDAWLAGIRGVPGETESAPGGASGT
jgi:adenosine deaminase